MNTEMHLRTDALKVLIAIAALVSSVLPGAAQEPAQAPTVGQPATLTPRTFQLRPLVTMSLAGVDTNILTTADEPVSDTALNVGGEIRPSLTLGPMRISGKASAGIAYFRKYRDQRSFDTDDDIRVDVEGNRLALFGTASYLRTRDPFDPEKQLRSPRTEYGFGAGGEIRSGDKTRIGVAARQVTIGFDDLVLLFHPLHQCPSVRITLNRTSRVYDAHLRYALTPITTLTAAAGLQRDRFEFSKMRDANAAGVEIGLDMKPSALISGKAVLGYRRFSNIADPSFQAGGIVGSIDVGYVADDSVRYGVRFERHLGHSFRTDESYYTATNLTGSVSKRLSRAWEMVGEVGHRWLAYTTRFNLQPGLEIFDTGIPVLTLDSMFRYDLGARYHLRDRTTFGATFAYYRVASADRRYDRMQLLFSTTHGF